MSGFPLSNQIRPGFPEVWLASGADRLWPSPSQAVLTTPGSCLDLASFSTTSVQRFGGGTAVFSKVWSLSQGLFDIFIMDPDDGREMVFIRTADHQHFGVNRTLLRKIVSAFQMILPHRNHGTSKT
jgi:hypothetical protein